jgi:RHS repeat-associated protein
MTGHVRRAVSARSVGSRLARSRWWLVAIVILVCLQIPVQARGLDGPAGTSPTAVTTRPPTAAVMSPPNVQDVTGPVGTLPDGVFPEGANVVAELPNLRTADSRTYLTASGSRVLMSYAGPVNYPDAKGVQQPIDDAATASQDGGWHNAANSFRASVPSTLGMPVSITAGDSTVSFALQGASTDGSTNLVVPTEVAGIADHSQVTFRDGLPRTDVAYAFGNTGLEETLAVAAQPVVDTYTWSLHLSSGLSAHMTDAGAAEVVDATGSAVMVFNRPTIADAKNLVGPTPKMSLSSDGSSMSVSLAPDTAWLADPGRAFPVSIDPTVGILQSGSECEMYQTVPNTVECNAGTTYLIGSGSLSGNAHSMFRFDNLVTSVPYDSLVQSANFNVYEQGAVNTNAIPIKLSTIANKAWTTSATWNKYNSSSGLSWTTAGGDFTTTPEAPALTAGTANGWIAYNPVKQVQAWVNGKDYSLATPTVAPNQGFMLTSDGASNAISVTNWLSATTAQWPYLSVQYMPRTGRGGGTDVLKTSLDDKTTLGVNAANGDLSVDTSLLNINGVGLPLAADLDYDSQGVTPTSMKTGTTGAGWALSPSFDQPRLVQQVEGVMDLTSSSGTNAVFTGESILGQWATSPPGLNATAGIVTSSTAQVTFKQSGEVWNFTLISGSTTVYHLSNIKDRNGHTVTYTYNTAGTQLTSVTDTEGRVVTIGYNANNLVSTITDSTSRQASFTYVNAGGGYRLDTATYGGNTTSYGYDTNGNLSQINGAAGSITVMVYNTNHQVTSVKRVTNASTMVGETTQYGYAPGSAASPTAGVTTVTDPNLNATTYKYDPWDRVGMVTDALGHGRQSTYNPQSSPQDLTDALTQVTKLRNDTNNNLTSITANKTSPTQANPAATTYQFNTPTSGGGAVTGGTYLASSSTDAQANCSSFTYDATGNQTASYSGFTSGTLCDGMTSGSGVTSVQNAYQGDGSTTCGGKPGELCSTTTGGGHVTNYSYNTLGELTQIIQPGGSCSPRSLCTTIIYDGLSRPLTVTDGKNQTTTYTYDDGDRITQILYNGTTTCTLSAGTCIQFEYDHQGNVTERDDKTGGTNFSYDLLNRLTEYALPLGLNRCAARPGMELTYDHNSNLATYCDAGGTTTYTYDAANNNTGVAYGSGSCAPTVVQPCTVYTYNNDNTLKKITYPTSTGVTDTLGYDGAAHQISERVTKTSDLSYQTREFFTGTTDRSLQQTQTNGITGIKATYTYTNQRLTASTGSGTGAINYAYTYDADGNMTKQTLGSAVTTYTYNASDALCWGISGTSANSCASPPTGANQYTYDANGNQTASTAGEALAYNSLNQTTSMTSPTGGTALSMEYTGTDSTQRTTTDPTDFANSIFGVAQSSTSAGTTYFTRTANGRLDHLTVGSTIYFPYYDSAGSIVGMFDTSGTNVATYTYDPYGATTATGTAASANPFRFKDGYQDTTSFYKFGTRYYNPSTASWAQADANQGTIQNPGTVNRYVYAGADPVDNVDATGRDFLDCFGAALGFGGAGLSFIGSGISFFSSAIDGPAGIAAGLGFAGAGLGAASAGIIAAQSC